MASKPGKEKKTSGKAPDQESAKKESPKPKKQLEEEDDDDELEEDGDVKPLSSTVGSEAWNSRDLKSRPH